LPIKCYILLIHEGKNILLTSQVLGLHTPLYVTLKISTFDMKTFLNGSWVILVQYTGGILRHHYI